MVDSCNTTTTRVKLEICDSFKRLTQTLLIIVCYKNLKIHNLLPNIKERTLKITQFKPAISVNSHSHIFIQLSTISMKVIIPDEGYHT